MQQTIITAFCSSRGETGVNNVEARWSVRKTKMTSVSNRSLSRLNDLRPDVRWQNIQKRNLTGRPYFCRQVWVACMIHCRAAATPRSYVPARPPLQLIPYQKTHLQADQCSSKTVVLFCGGTWSIVYPDRGSSGSSPASRTVITETKNYRQGRRKHTGG